MSRIPVSVWKDGAWPAFAVILIMLVAVQLLGAVSGGSRRWLDTGIIRLQPSELMKLTLVLALSKFYGQLPPSEIRGWNALWPAGLAILTPFGLVLTQPDLGTATMIAAGGIVIVFLAGVPMRLFAAAGVTLAAALPIVWSLMHDYQRNRVLIFLNPESDPLGTGYHITQSKIAIGSGGLFGVGYMQGTQSQLDFLPERHTDFVFAMLLEEFGMVGGLFVLALYLAAMAFGIYISIGCRHIFGKFLAAGITMLLFIYVGINAGMIMGLMPVVGEPLPFLSYGGSVMLSLMFGFGLVQNAKVFRDKTLRSGFKSSKRVR
jgi:rod shape determining protein RodA